MENSSRIQLTKTKRHIKLIETYLKPLKGDQRKNFTQKNCKSLKVMQKKAWSLMKEILGKCIQYNELNTFFTNIGTDLANKNPNASKRFDFYIIKVNTSMESQPLPINELKDAFFSLKTKKTSNPSWDKF